MSDLTAPTYLRHLVDAVLGVEVTDGDGASLDLEAGASLVVELLLAAASARRKALLFGNGGSAAIVSHVHNDLCKAVGVRALVFNEAPLLTATANDEGYGRVFELPMELWADPGDLVLAVSSSGRSDNILRGVRAARHRGCRVVTLSGFQPDNPLRRLGDINFWVPSRAYGYVEVAHQALGHMLTDRAVRAQSKGEPPEGYP